MKKLLLDTHSLLWWLQDSTALGERAHKLIKNPSNQIFVSAASIWEIEIKRSQGKLKAPTGWETIIEEEGFQSLPIDIFHAEQARQLPMHHKDPFDRVIIAQAQAEGLTIVSADNQFSHYGVRLLDARA